MKKQLILLAFLLATLSCAQKSDWKPLFNGKDFTGFTQLNGKAIYKVENGEMIGISTANTPNSFMCTEQEYGDFILEFEVKVDPKLNSGVQIRSHDNKRVYGYQVEIDPSDRGWSAGIYDEARRGWLYPVTVYNPEAKTAFKNGEWNVYRVEAIGNRITTWLNGIPVADLLDNEDSKGFIGFQVHAVPAELANTEVRWRNIRIITDNIDKHSLQNTVSIQQVNAIPNTISDSEKAQGWRLLFDGTTTQGWRGAHADKFPEKGWNIVNGVLSVEPSGGAESKNGGDIVTDEEFSNFELLVDFKITKGANSGIKYFVTENYATKGSAIGLEYQILDDKEHPDAKMGRDGNRTLASLYDLITAQNKRFNGIDQWNTAKLLVNGNHVEHWLNGFKVLEYERGSDDFRQLVKQSKYKDFKGFGEAERGRILLQDHGDAVSFRSIKIRTL